MVSIIFCTFVIVIEITIATVGYGSAYLNRFGLRSPCTTVVIKKGRKVLTWILFNLIF